MLLGMSNYTEGEEQRKRVIPAFKDARAGGFMYFNSYKYRLQGKGQEKEEDVNRKK